MPSIRMLLLLVVVLSFSACAAPSPRPQHDLSDPVTVRTQTTKTYDEFKKITTYLGPDLSPVRYEALLIRAFGPDARNMMYQIYVRDQYGKQWRFYNSAYDSDGNKLEFLSISRDVGSCRYGCDYYEDMGIGVSRQYLEQHKTTGLRFKISGRGGEEIYQIPAGYVRGFLDAIEK